MGVDTALTWRDEPSAAALAPPPGPPLGASVAAATAFPLARAFRSGGRSVAGGREGAVRSIQVRAAGPAP